ncbi:unnamed protein product [Paramecium sonneborni]|uniref:Uncharacterized protein n=1 Tax=Paramecium sonneborni TaxID=65129 RepID=A0A8S1P7G4_9CILI|nr:unnamed protein product [Paramecium sonneborni]
MINFWKIQLMKKSSLIKQNSGQIQREKQYEIFMVWEDLKTIERRKENIVINQRTKNLSKVR